MFVFVTLRLITALICALLCSSCREGSGNEKVIGGPPQPGALYSLADGEGGYRLGKVLAVDDEVILINLFGDRWIKRPSLAEAHKAVKPIAVAYKSQSFVDMRPVHLESGSVTAPEKEAYEAWQQGNREIF